MSRVAKEYAQGELNRYRALYKLTHYQGLSKQAAHQVLDRAVEQTQEKDSS
jgi:hypothetical protein